MYQKELSYTDVLLAGIGYILGAGIYALIGVIAGYSRNMTWLSTIIAGILALVTSYSYIQLSKSSEKNESEYHLLAEAFGNKISTLIILFSVISVIFSCATISIGFGNYLYGLTGINPMIGGILILITTGLVNMMGIRKTVDINSITTIMEFSGLVIIIIAGISYWKIETILKYPPKPIRSIAYSSYLFIFAFFGFESLIRLSEETDNAKEVIPYAIRDSIIITSILYTLVSISSIARIGWFKLSKSKSPLADVIKLSRIPYGFQIMSIIAIASTYNTVLMSVLTNSRLVQALAKNGVITIPGIDLGEITEYGIPNKSIMINIIVSILVMVLLFDIEKTTIISNMGILTLLVSINLAYVKTKITS